MDGDAIVGVIIGSGGSQERRSQQPVGAVSVPLTHNLNLVAGLQLLGQTMLMELGTADRWRICCESVE